MEKRIYKVYFSDGGSERTLQVYASDAKDAEKMFIETDFGDGVRYPAESINWIEFIS